MYHQSAAVHRRSISASGGVPDRRRQTTRGQEQIRLVQLAVCLLLFLTVFLWKGVFPQKLVQVRDNILTLISTDLDFEQALAGLGKSLSGSGSMLAEFGDFCTEVFGPAQEAEPPRQTAIVPPRSSGLLEAELQFLSAAPEMAPQSAHYMELSRFGLTYVPEEPAQVPEEPEEAPPVSETVQPEEPAVPAAGTVIAFSDYSGDPLPENYTMDQVSLGNLETITPVLGHLNSDYGYRDHPINGQYIFHGGIDIGGQFGDPIAAFAAGTVEYTGENDSYGLYLQVDHGNGVKSFYAHCSKIEVVKGQTVAMGDTVARIGSTGSSTGPHLHLELKYNKMHLNPAYYVDLL